MGGFGQYTYLEEANHGLQSSYETEIQSFLSMSALHVVAEQSKISL